MCDGEKTCGTCRFLCDWGIRKRCGWLDSNETPKWIKENLQRYHTELKFIYDLDNDGENCPVWKPAW